MTRVYLLFFFLTGLSLVSNAQAEITFKESSHDFGTVHAGKDTLWYNFTFTNTGNEPLQINDVKTSCDCTLAEWPKGVIQPGKSAVVRGGFKIENKSGSFEKSVIIISNTSPATSIITIKGVIGDSAPQ
ncbi:MAG: DUF1573 domain-containing protein [Cytophaga sp.]|uniref:DUF1573 domain-containing protein n=1 Tax=Cytophaga sp. TaxID=29535 RepID=UPI003F80E7A4